jgi:hypothetical protein
MSALRLAYLFLALLGATLPMREFLTWLAANDWSVSGMIDAWFANPAVAGLAWDLTISAAVLTLWIAVEARARGDRLALAVIPSIYLIGVSFALPFYLFLRSRPTERD